MADATAAARGESGGVPQYYDPSALLTRPVTTIQVTSFTPREGMAPSLVLADGSHYYGPLIEDNKCRVPCGCGIMLFQYDETAAPSSDVAENGGGGGGGGFTSFFFGRGVPQGGAASQAASSFTTLCKRYQHGDRYGGDWANGVFHGDGVLVTGNFTYHGTWREGQMQGKGTISYTRKYVDYRPRNPNSGADGSGGGVGANVGNLLLKGLSYVSPFDLVATAAAPKEYIGDFDAQNYRHGSGIMRYYNGDVYEGEWRDNCRHGRGKLLKLDGEVYDGEWAFDQRHGNGKIMFPNGSLFKGCMEFDQRHGEGVMRFANGDEYFGQFARDRIDGHGTMRYRNGDVYEGTWRDQLRHGQGKYTLKRTGATMRGEFQSGLIHGEGTVVVPGVSTFVGIFIRGERTIGTMHWEQQPGTAAVEAAAMSAAAAAAGGVVSAAESPLPSPAEAGLAQNAASSNSSSPSAPSPPPPPASPTAAAAVGVAAASTAAKASTRHYLCYQGEWHGEHMHGRGLLWYANGDFFAGRFHKSLRHGPGNMRYAAEQAEFSGQYVHGVRHGLGLLQRADKTIRAGRWQHNAFVGGYEGEWNGSVFHGIGRLMLPVETFLAMRASNSTLKLAELSAMLADGAWASPAGGAAAAGDEEGRPLAPDRGAVTGADATAASAVAGGQTALSPFFIDYFGLFRDGVRDGLGMLKLPALDGLVGGSLNLADQRKPSSGGDNANANSGGGGGGAAAAGGRAGKSLKDMGRPINLATVPSMVIKGRWVREVLHCDKGVWAFPNGTVYIGPFRNGARVATRACLWGPDGSVLECGWAGDAPCGTGVWHQRNRVDPVYQTIVPSVLRRSRVRRALDTSAETDAVAATSDAATSATGDAEVTSAALAGDLFGLSYLWGLIGSGLMGGLGVGEAAGSTSQGDADTEDEADRSDRPRRVLVDFSNHYTFSCSWCPHALDLSAYTAVVLPQVAAQTAPLPGGATWPQLFHSPTMAAAAAPAPEITPDAGAKTKGNGNRGGSGGARAGTTSAGAVPGAPPIGGLPWVPWPVPTAKQMSACATALHLADAPSAVAVGRASGTGVVYFNSGVVLAGEWLGNVPRLAIPYRPWSALDHFATWQSSRAAARNCAGTVLHFVAPRLQSCYTDILTEAPDDVRGEPRRVAGGRLTVAASPLALGGGGGAGTAAAAGDGQGAAVPAASAVSSPPAPDTRCSLCSKEYSFFRKRVHCTLCLRSTCTSCLGPMDTDGPALQEDVKALLRHASLASESVVQLAAAAAAKTALTNAAGGPARPLAFPSITAAQVDHAYDKRSVSTLPVCADCVRAVLWKLRYSQLWIPVTMFASVVEGDKQQRELRRRGEAGVASRTDGNADDGNDEATASTMKPLAADDDYGRESTRQVSAVGESLPGSVSRTAPDDSDSAAAAVALPTMLAATVGGAEAVDDAATPLAPAADTPDGTRTGSPGDAPSTPRGASAGASHALAATSADASPAPAVPPPAAFALSASRRARSTATLDEPPRSGSELLPPTQYIIYCGYTSHTIPHVYGELWWGRQHYYRGGFCAGERHGFGTQYMPNGEWYEGSFARDAWHGEGVYHLEDGSVLLAEFRRGKVHDVHFRGEVEETLAAGVRPHGRGFGYSPDGSIYNGEWVHGRRHGTGMLQFADGSSVYSGTFVADAMEGMGKLVTTSGAYYGDFSQNQQNGKGLLFTSTCVVEGSWVQGTSCGFTRTYERATGEVYETTYRDGNERDDCFTAPVMIEDGDAAECGQCGTAFSFFLRRHHCRLCGDVFCDTCTQHRATLPATVTGEAGSGGSPSGNSGSGSPRSPTSTSASGQQLRVCDACFYRLTQRRMVALRRYADDSVYAGCWSQGRWVSRGLYCRPDGIFVVMDSHGHAMLPLADVARAKELLLGGAAGKEAAAKAGAAAAGAAVPAGGLGVGRRPSRTTGLPISPSILQDAAPSKELLDGVMESSTRKDLDAFLLWWSTTRSRCGLHVPLDVSLVGHYQRMPAQMLRGKDATVRVGSDAAMYLAAPARCTLEVPHTPSLAPIHLFVTLADSRRAMQAMVEGEVDSASALTSSATETADAAASSSASAGVRRVSEEERRTIDGDVEAAALRASRFMPVAIPRAPIVPITSATIPITGSAADPAPSTVTTTRLNPGSALGPPSPHAGDAASQAFGVSAWATRPPPSIASEDISDEALVDMMRAERLSWSAAKAPAGAGELGGAGSAPAPPPLMPPTPTLPPAGVNTQVPWDTWTTRDVPRYLPPPVTSVAAESGSMNDSATASSASSPPPPPRTEADMYFACPSWGPTVPDAQQLLEQGKMTQAAQLMHRLQRHSASAASSQSQLRDWDSSDADDSGDEAGGKAGQAGAKGAEAKARRGQTGADPSTTLWGGAWDAGRLLSPEQRAQSGGGWAPAPMRGPFVFDISSHERRQSADGQRWYAKVTQREVTDF